MHHVGAAPSKHKGKQGSPQQRKMKMESIAIIQEAETRKSRKSAKSSSSTPSSISPEVSSGVNGAIDASSSTENRPHTAKPTVHPQQEKKDNNKNNETHNRKGKVQKTYSFNRFWRPIPRMLACMLRPDMRHKRSQDEQSPNQSLSSLFFGLPTELQLEIITQLSINDISRLRQTSRAFSALIELHESHIVRENIQKRVPKYISILFPLPDTAPATLKYLQEITYRREESDSLAEVLAQRIVREMGKSRAQKAPVCPKVLEYVVEQLKLGFSPLIFAIFHFLETYHRRKSQELSGTGPFNESTLEDKEREIQSDIMLQYPDCLLLQIHQMYHLLLHLLTRRLTLTSWYSRPVRRWHVSSVTGRPDDEALAKLLLLGGIPEVSRLHKLKGCGKRRKELEKYLKKTANQSQGEAPMKFHGGTIKDGISINIDKLSQIWVPAAEKQLLTRGIVTDLDSIRCCGEFVAELLGDGFASATEKTIQDANETSEDSAQQPAQIIAALRFGHTHLRFADDGNWDRDLILEGEDDFDDDLGENELKEKEECEMKRPTTPISKPVAGPSRSPGTIVGLTTPVPGCAGNGYNGMGANFMNMTL